MPSQNVINKVRYKIDIIENIFLNRRMLKNISAIPIYTFIIRFPKIFLLEQICYVSKFTIAFLSGIKLALEENYFYQEMFHEKLCSYQR